jgi:hypothetical protein
MKTTTEINEKMAQHYEQLALLHRQLAHATVTGDEVVVLPPQRETSDEGKRLWKHRYTVVSGHEGQFAMLIKAMFDDGWFLKEDGTRATSVEDVAHYVGHCLGQDYPDWRQTLRGAVLPKCFTNFISKLMHWLKIYKATIKHDNDS